MTSTMTSSWRRSRDHFEPHDIAPEDQRRIRGWLEQIDYTAFVSNRELLGRVLGQTDMAALQRLAVTVAGARAQWAAEALRMAGAGQPPAADAVARLADLRRAFEELSEAYEGLRRMVERGYLTPD